MKKPHWSEREKAILREHYPAISSHTLAKAFKGRSPGAVIDQATRMGLRKCHDRLREMGMENCNRRWERERGR